MEQNRRLYYFDNVKAFLIISVVIGHFIDISTNTSHVYRCIFGFIYTFHMPLFIFISGLFHKDDRIFQKALTDIIIGFILKIFIFTLTLGPIRKASFQLFSGGGVPWFMFTLAVYEVLAFSLRNIDKKFLFIVFFVIGCFVGYDSSISDFLYLSRIFVFFPFYILGLIVDKDDLMNLCAKKNLKILSFTILAAWFACFYFFEYTYKLRGLFTGRNPFGSFSNEIIHVYGGFFRLLCYIITVVVGFSVLCIIPQNNLGFFSAYGKKTIQVYFWHPIFLFYLSRLFGSTLVITSFGKIIWILCAIVVSFVLGIRVFSFPVKQIRENCRKTMN